MKITCVTPTVRPEGLAIVHHSLLRQAFRDFEWLIVTAAKYIKACQDVIQDTPLDIIILEEPPKKEEDYYCLNKAWNQAFRNMRGKLFVSVVDLIWFPPDTLGKLWNHYEANPKACISTIGHQYDEIKNGKPEHLVWRDPRARIDFGSFYEVSPREMEFCLASIPKKAIYDVGGIDEEYDKYAALSEKEMCARIDKLGYKFYLDQSIEYRALKHPRLSAEWDERYNKGCEIYAKHLQEISEGKRLKLNYI